MSSPSSHSQLVQLVLARLKSFYREPGALFWSFGFPIFMSIALGVAFRNRPPEPMPIAIEAGPSSAAIEKKLAGKTELRVRTMGVDEAKQALRSGRVDLVVKGDGEGRVYAFDPTRPEGRMARLLVDDLLQRADGRADPTQVSEARVTEPGSRYIDFLLPGLVGMGLLSSGLWGIGFVIVEMRSKKLLKRFIATPMNKAYFLLAFVLMRALFLVVELPVLFGFGALVFGVPILGSIPLLFGVAVAGALTFAGVGILVASRAENTQTAQGLINLVTLPMFLLSGTFFSSARFPDAIQPFVRALPLTAVNDALRAVMLQGAGPAQIAKPMLVLGVWAAVSFALALKLFRFR